MSKFKRFLRSQDGFVKPIVKVVLMLVVLGALVPILWPLMTGTDADIQAMNVTEGDVATPFLQTIWPIVLLVVGIGIAAGLVFYALRKFGILGGKG